MWIICLFNSRRINNPGEVWYHGLVLGSTLLQCLNKKRKCWPHTLKTLCWRMIEGNLRLDCSIPISLMRVKFLVGTFVTCNLLRNLKMNFTLLLCCENEQLVVLTAVIHSLTFLGCKSYIKVLLAGMMYPGVCLPSLGVATFSWCPHMEQFQGMFILSVSTSFYKSNQIRALACDLI